MLTLEMLDEMLRNNLRMSQAVVWVVSVDKFDSCLCRYFRFGVHRRYRRRRGLPALSLNPAPC